MIKAIHRRAVATHPKRKTPRRKFLDGRKLRKSWQLYVVFALPFFYILLFHYLPMYGIQLAFKEYDGTLGIWGSPWVGLDNFKRFISSYNFWQILFNTVSLSLYSLLAGLPIPILLAISLNECRFSRFKKLVQTVSYAPHFISTVVMVSMIIMALSVNNGLINNILALFHLERVNFMAEPTMFKTIYVLSGIWQGAGYSSIIYLATLSGIDPTLYEAAIIDGASKMKKIWYIDLPFLVPTMVILLILAMGGLMNVGFEKVFLMQNSLNLSSSEIIATYVYKLGIERADFSYSTAIGVFNSVINLLLIVSMNKVARKISDVSLW